MQKQWKPEGVSFRQWPAKRNNPEATAQNLCFNGRRSCMETTSRAMDLPQQIDKVFQSCSLNAVYTVNKKDTNRCPRSCCPIWAALWEQRHVREAWRAARVFPWDMPSWLDFRDAANKTSGSEHPWCFPETVLENNLGWASSPVISPRIATWVCVAGIRPCPATWPHAEILAILFTASVVP